MKRLFILQSTNQCIQHQEMSRKFLRELPLGLRRSHFQTALMITHSRNSPMKHLR